MREDTAERMRGLYGFRQERFRSRFDPDGDGAVEERSQTTSACAASCSTPSGSAVQDLRQQGGSATT